MSALLNAADSTQMETERDMQSVEKEYEKMDSKLRRAADEEASFTAKLRTDALGYEQKLTAAYESHKAAVEGKSLELAGKDEELQQGQHAMHQWRGQWEEELTEKNSIDAELLTLRSEFEKSRHLRPHAHPHPHLCMCSPAPTHTCVCVALHPLTSVHVQRDLRP